LQTALLGEITSKYAAGPYANISHFGQSVYCVAVWDFESIFCFL